jgi:3-oxoacyl-[acyl-carrier-protein] synthase II
MRQMEFYIQAASAISPQKELGSEPLPAGTAGNRLSVVEPDYTGLIDPKAMRRMSRIIRMGVGAAVSCLRAADVNSPDAIVTGTAYGCLADTEVFLNKMIGQAEEMLPPTAFIQSTHNTVGGQIALMLKCHGYNNTFVHRGHSFESALLDAMMLLREKEDSNVLVGGLDEITDTSHAILSRFGLYRHATAGEGAAFFLLTGRRVESTCARLQGLDTFYKPKDAGEIEARVHSFLVSLMLCPQDIDLLIMGNNGDPAGDKIYGQLSSAAFGECETMSYKDLCGEYPTSASFALWLAVDAIREGRSKRVLIYNHYLGIYHSLMVVSR